MEFINLLEDSYPLYELCRKNSWTSYETFEKFYQNSGELDFFEGDPDMIKIDGEYGYFFKYGETVFYWIEWKHDAAEMMLKKFFATFKTGITRGGESYCYGENPPGVVDIKKDHWKIWERMDTGIAYRGGAGYTYWISDWSEWLEEENKKSCEILHAEYFTA